MLENGIDSAAFGSPPLIADHPASSYSVCPLSIAIVAVELMTYRLFGLKHNVG
jgi:hypothetical protein